MKRSIDYHLIEWKNSVYRKPLLLRGARQIGKTYAVRQLGASFENFVEVNFESEVKLSAVFDKDLSPETIILELSLLMGTEIIPGRTLLFFDEIQIVPKALIALRYFYEKMPELHVIAAGSLLDFATQAVGIPVGRISSLYMYPLSFFEFLCAGNHTLLAQVLLTQSPDKPFSELVHEKLLIILAEYLAIGGMPEAVMRWQATHNLQLCAEVHYALLDTYRQDFNKYAQRFQVKYLTILFNAIPRQMGTKFKYTALEGDYRKRELAPCVDLLSTAGIVSHVTRTAAQGIPLGAQVDPSDFKLIFLDVALSQTLLGLDLKDWILSPQQEFINKGPLIEAFVGQELLAYGHPGYKMPLFYWQRTSTGSEAEVDYVIQNGTDVVPIEVKSGLGSTLRSMRMFLESHPQSPYGLRFSTHNYQLHNAIHSYPLYGIISFMLARQQLGLTSHEDMLKSYQALIST